VKGERVRHFDQREKSRVDSRKQILHLKSRRKIL